MGLFFYSLCLIQSSVLHFFFNYERSFNNRDYISNAEMKCFKLHLCPQCLLQLVPRKAIFWSSFKGLSFWIGNNFLHKIHIFCLENKRTIIPLFPFQCNCQENNIDITVNHFGFYTVAMHIKPHVQIHMSDYVWLSLFLLWSWILWSLKSSFLICS